MWIYQVTSIWHLGQISFEIIISSILWQVVPSAAKLFNFCHENQDRDGLWNKSTRAHFSNMTSIQHKSQPFCDWVLGQEIWSLPD